VRTGWTRLSALVVVVVLSIAVLGWAQQAGTTVPSPTATQPIVGIGDAAASRATPEPYVAEATGNDVFIRSGKGTQFYQCGKLYAGDRVQVINVQDGWSCILPPPGCFSWVSMQYVSINLENPTMGIITGDNVGVYAGSDFMEPRWSTSKQCVLNRGQTVRLLGEEKDDYYKIAPPQGAYLWVSSQFLQAADRPVSKPAETNVGPAVKASEGRPAPADPNAPKTDLDVYYALAEQIKAERAKPTGEQDYAAFKTKLAELAAKEDGGRAARYAEYTIQQVERFELACKVAKEVELQNKELQKTTSKIDEARVAKLAQFEDRSKFAVMGRLETSSVYADGPTKRFRLLDDSGKTICYVMPVGAAASRDYSDLIGRKVGLVGKIEAHEATSRAIIQFSEAVPLE
jgi:uncharacterized protein YgiM (DUF1202 family)